MTRINKLDWTNKDAREALDRYELIVQRAINEGVEKNAA